MHHLPVVAEELLKPTATIHVGNKLSLIERKVFNAIIWHSQKSRQGRPTDTLSVSLLMSLIGLERSKNLDVIKEALETLVTTPIVWNTLRKDRTADWGICSFLSGAELSGGRFRYVLNPLLAEKVYSPTLFAKIQLLVQTQFSSKYSLALYEFLLDELGRAGNPSTHEVEVSLDTVRHVLQFEGAFKHLNNDVLKPCVQEINKHADIRVGYRGVKKARAVVGIIFAVERAGLQFEMPLDDLRLLEAGDVSPEKDALALLLIERGMGTRKAHELVRSYDEERIRENLAYVEKEAASGRVKSVSAYLVRAIEEDYRKAIPPETRRKDNELRQRHDRNEDLRAREAQRRAFEQYRLERVRARFEALPEAEREARRQAFGAELERSRSILVRHYKKEGFGSRLVEAEFLSRLADDLLTEPAEREFEEFAKGYAPAGVS